MDRGLFWRLDVLDPSTGELITEPQLEASLEDIRKLSAAQQPGVPIGALTCLDRTEWYKVSLASRGWRWKWELLVPVLYRNR